MKRKPLTELYVHGNYTEDREQWNHEPQRHCEEVHMDPEESQEVQEGTIEYFKRKGDQQLTKEGRGAEITIDMVLETRAKMSDTKVNGPEDAAVIEMIKQLLQEKIYITTKRFQECFMGQMEAPSSWKIVTLVVLRKPSLKQRLE